MQRSAPRFWIYVLVVLLTTWGTCPCVFAKMIRAAMPESASETASEAGAPASVAPC